MNTVQLDENTYLLHQDLDCEFGMLVGMFNAYLSHLSSELHGSGKDMGEVRLIIKEMFSLTFLMDEIWSCVEADGNTVVIPNEYSELIVDALSWLVEATMNWGCMPSKFLDVLGSKSKYWEKDK